jgi:hypothetical protein
MSKQLFTIKNCHTGNKACSEQSDIVRHPKADINTFCSFGTVTDDIARFRLTCNSPITNAAVIKVLAGLGIPTKRGDTFIRLCQFHYNEKREALQAPLKIIGRAMDVINRLAVDLFSDGLNADPNRPPDTVEVIGEALLSENNVGRVGQFAVGATNRLKNYAHVGNALSITAATTTTTTTPPPHAS